MINITEIEQKKEFLKSYRNQCYKIKSLQEQKSSIIETMASAKAQTYNDMPTSGMKSDLSDYMVKLEKIMKDIDNAYAECLAKKIAIESSVLRMNDGMESAVLHKRYILFKSWTAISIELGYERTQIHRLHGKALQHIEIGGFENVKEQNICSRF